MRLITAMVCDPSSSYALEIIVTLMKEIFDFFLQTWTTSSVDTRTESVFCV